MIRLAATIATALTLSACKPMSPCECLLSGGCGVEFLPAQGAVYADGTVASDYDMRGRYIGADSDVPDACR